MYAISAGNETHLLDCGLLQGHRRETFEINSHLPFAADSIRSVVLSHAHLDHSGNLPTLVRSGFQGRIHSTPATAELCKYMLADSAHLQERDAAFIEKRNSRRHAIGANDQNLPVPRFTPSPTLRGLSPGSKRAIPERGKPSAMALPFNSAMPDIFWVRLLFYSNAFGMAVRHAFCSRAISDVPVFRFFAIPIRRLRPIT
jgi:Metallo-beta-lactamase superfamily